MWGGLGSNLTNIVASVQKLSAELESQMDAAVGANPAESTVAPPSAIAALDGSMADLPSMSASAPAAPPAPALLAEEATPPPVSIALTVVEAQPSASDSSSSVAAVGDSPVAAAPGPQTPPVDKPKSKKKVVKSGVKKKTTAGSTASPPTAVVPPAPLVRGVEDTGAAAVEPLVVPATAARPKDSPKAVKGDLPLSATEDSMMGLRKEKPEEVREEISRVIQDDVPSPPEPPVPQAVKPVGTLSTEAKVVHATEAPAPPLGQKAVESSEPTEMIVSPPQTLEAAEFPPNPPTEGAERGAATERSAVEGGDADPTPGATAELLARVSVMEKENIELSATVLALKRKVEQMQSTISSRDSTIESLRQDLLRSTEECGRLAESLQSRERSLESVMSQMVEVNAQLSSKSGQVDSMAESNAAMAAKLKAHAASSGTEAELRRLIANLTEENREKDDRLQSYDQEGQALAKKQGDMEKLIRKSKGELREKEAEIAKLKDGREQLVKTIEEMQEIIKQHDSNSTNTSKSISAMQAVSQASMERLAKLEADLATKTEEILNQKRALDNAWNENAELKRASSELRAERDDIKKHKDVKNGKISEQETLIRDLEQREAVLRATNKQLQDSLQRQMNDSSAREDRLREEILDARKRWQDAISNRESLAAEVGQSTGPLLRQIAGLQESLKTKTEAWQGVESSLLERALRAESSAESSTYKMKALEEKFSAVTKSNDELTSRLHDKESKLQDLQIGSERWARQEREYSERIADLESRLSNECTIRLNAQGTLRELESRMKSEIRDSKDTVESSHKQNQLKIQMLNSEIEELTEQLNMYKPLALEQGNRSKNVSKVKSENALNDANTRNSSVSVNNNFLANGEVSYVSANRISQQLEMKEQENHSLTLQLQQLQLSRSALLQEVSYLSARNAELEESLDSNSNSTEAIARLEKENAVLLNLLGEKEEELENVLDDLKDVKNLYKLQLEALYDQLTPHQGGSEIVEP